MFKVSRDDLINTDIDISFMNKYLINNIETKVNLIIKDYEMYESNDNLFETFDDQFIDKIINSPIKSTSKSSKLLPITKTSIDKTNIKLNEDSDCDLESLLNELEPSRISTKILNINKPIEKINNNLIHDPFTQPKPYIQKQFTTLKTKVVKKIQLIDPSQPLTTKYFQDEACKSYLENKDNNMIITIANSSGKTFTIYLMIKHSIFRNDKTFIVITSTDDLLYQISEKIYRFMIKEEITSNYFIHDMNINNKPYLNLINVNTIDQISSNNIIFTTYNRSFDLLKLLNEKNIKINCVFSDESHNMIERLYNYYNNNLLEVKYDNEELKVCSILLNYFDKILSKKVFMTATPLSIDIKLIDKLFSKDKYSKLSDNIKDNIIKNLTLYSMNNNIIYGNIIYDYPINKALTDESIVDWNTIIITKKEYRTNIKRLLSSIINIKLQIDSFLDRFAYKYKFHVLYTTERILYNIISNNISHIIVYTNDTKSIDCIECSFKFWISLMNSNQYKTDKEIKCNIYNILGNNNTEMIDNYKTSIKPIKTPNTFNLREFNIIITNNGINEGIELSMCSMVSFIIPKILKHEIIQNIGRCIRKIPKKDKSFVLFSEGVMIDINTIRIGPFDTIIKVNNDMKNDQTKMCFI